MSLSLLAGCSTLGVPKPRSDKQIRLEAVDVLNRRETEERFELAVEYEGDPIRVAERTIEGADDPSSPTGIEFSDWPDERGSYRFSFRLDGRERWLRVTPEDTGIRPENVDCYRMVFVINLGDRLNALAQGECS